jgi:hypothetical protein
MGSGAEGEDVGAGGRGVCVGGVGGGGGRELCTVNAYIVVLSSIYIYRAGITGALGFQ